MNSKQNPGGPEVRYRDFGAVGDGVADDLEAIIRAHGFANENNRSVRAEEGAVYYLGGAAKTAVIMTDTDWTGASFIIDDTRLENRGSLIFKVVSRLPAIPAEPVPSLKKNQRRLELRPGRDCIVTATDQNARIYIREGANQNNGSPMSDVFIIDGEGNIDPNTPVLWDFRQVTAMTLRPMDTETLTLRGGHFTTLANQAESKYNYHGRGIHISRSNTVVDSIRHEVKNEGETGAPYGGFIGIADCANVTVKNSVFTGHRTYWTIGSANVPVPMGSYDLSVGRAVGISFRNCRQFDDIHDTDRWGVFGSNGCKNLLFDGVEFSRFDAHQGVANATIKNSVLGHQGVNAIGNGLLLIENSTLCGYTAISLRNDYGSTWEGEFVLRNCTFIPRNGTKSDAVLIGGHNSGMHDFGYICQMPEKITIDGLTVIDNNTPDGYTGPKIFEDFNSAYTSDAFVEKYPYGITAEVVVRGLSVKSGKPLSVSDNRYMFRNVKVTQE